MKPGDMAKPRHVRPVVWMYPSELANEAPYPANLPAFNFGLVIARFSFNSHHFQRERTRTTVLVIDSTTGRMGWTYPSLLEVVAQALTCPQEVPKPAQGIDL